MSLLDRAVKIRFDDVTVEIADDEQGRIEQRFAVLKKLFIGGFEVLFLALVFPGKAALFPHVGKASFLGSGFLTGIMQRKKFGVFHHALLETEEIAAARVGLNRGRLAEKPAKVGEVLLVRRGFLRLGAAPLLLEFGGGHGSATNWQSFSRLGMSGFYRKVANLSAWIVTRGAVCIRIPGGIA